jgi:hypothetical protein
MTQWPQDILGMENVVLLMVGSPLLLLLQRAHQIRHLDGLEYFRKPLSAGAAFLV